MLPYRGFFAALCAVTLISAQEAPKKQLTARELFYKAAPPSPTLKAPQRTASRSTATPAKAVEIARADPQPSTPGTRTPEAPASMVKVAAQTAPMPTSGALPLGLRYTILKINADNSTTEVAPDTVFHSGDRIRFSLESNASGNLYIVNQGSSGTWKPMFPSAEVDDGNARIEGWRPYTMPPKSRLAFDTLAGTENLFIVFSRHPEPDLEKMIYSLQGKNASKPEEPVRSDKTLIMAANIPNDAVNRMRDAYARDLIVERVNQNTPGDLKETAVYVVNASGNDDSRVVADLHLVHR